MQYSSILLPALLPAFYKALFHIIIYRKSHNGEWRWKTKTLVSNKHHLLGRPSWSWLSLQVIAGIAGLGKPLAWKKSSNVMTLFKQMYYGMDLVAKKRNDIRLDHIDKNDWKMHSWLASVQSLRPGTIMYDINYIHGNCWMSINNVKVKMKWQARHYARLCRETCVVLVGFPLQLEKQRCTEEPWCLHQKLLHLCS